MNYRLFYYLVLLTFLPLYIFGLQHGEEVWWGCQKGKAAVIEKSNSLVDYPDMAYPNIDYETLASLYSKRKVSIFLYDVWMDPDVIEKYLGRHVRITAKLSSAFALKRLFNVDGENGGFIHEFPISDSSQSAVLNVVRTGDIGSTVNGIVVEIDFEDLTRLAYYQVGYDLVPVVVMNWIQTPEQFCGGSARVVYTFSASDLPREGKIYTTTKKAPIPQCLTATEDASFKVGEALGAPNPPNVQGLPYKEAAYIFHKKWLHSTFFGDGVTPIPCGCPTYG